MAGLLISCLECYRARCALSLSVRFNLVLNVPKENMSSCTDPLHLNDKRLFKELKRSLSGNAKETQNILEIRDDVLYVWNADKCCVQTLNVGATRGKFDEDVTYQVCHRLIYLLFVVVIVIGFPIAAPLESTLT